MRIMKNNARLQAKTLSLVLLTIALFVAYLPGAEAQESTSEAAIKIAVVNLDYVVTQSPAGKELQATLEKFQKDAQAEIGAKMEAANSIRQTVAAAGNTLSDEKLGELQKEFEDAQIDIRRLQDDKQREGQKLQNDGLRVIETQLEPIFEAIRDEGGYDLILNNVPGVVVMAGDRVDITSEVVQRLQAQSGS